MYKRFRKKYEYIRKHNNLIVGLGLHVIKHVSLRYCFFYCVCLINLWTQINILILSVFRPNKNVDVNLLVAHVLTSYKESVFVDHIFYSEK